MALRLFLEANVFVSCFLEVDLFCLLTLPHPISVGIKVLTYLGLMAN